MALSISRLARSKTAPPLCSGGLRILLAAALLALTLLIAPPVAGAQSTASSATSAWMGPVYSSHPVRLDGAVDTLVRNAQARRLGHFTSAQPVQITVALYAPHPDQERQFLAEVQTKGSPLFHHYLSNEAWTARFAPSAADEQAVVDWAQQQGLSVLQRWSNRLLVNLAGSVGTIEHAFNLSLNRYRMGTSTFVSADRGPQLPARLSNVVLSVLGLDSRQVLQPGLARRSAPPINTTLTPYSGGPLIGRPTALQIGGRGQHDLPLQQGPRVSGRLAPRISNGAYDPTDLYSSNGYDYAPLFTLSHCCNPAAGARGAGATIAILGVNTVSGADLQGFSAMYPYVAFNVTKLLVGGTSPTGTLAAEETTLDTEYAAAMSNNSGVASQAAPITVYEATDAGIGSFVTEMQSIIDNFGPRVVSTSFFVPEAIAGQGGARALDQELSQLAATGRTVVAAAGDNGPYGSNDPNNLQSCVANTPNADLPAADPNVVAAGGTTLLLNGDGSYNSESAWSGPSSYCGYNQGGGGGGCSSFFTAQSYQQNIEVYTPCNGKRAYPDLSLNASASTLQNFYFNGSVMQNAGTSIVAPELAGFFAQENSYLSTLGSVCGASGTTQCGPLGNPDYAIYGVAFGGSPHSFIYDTQSGCTGNAAGPGYCAAMGYDLATGWGSVNMLQMAWAINYYSTPGIDTPIAGFSGAAPHTWYNYSPGVTVNVTDTSNTGAPSGIAGLSGGWDHDPGDVTGEPNPGSGNSYYNGPTLPGVSTGTFTVPPRQGCHTLYVRAWDNQGVGFNANNIAVPVSVTGGPYCIDTIPPTVSSLTLTPSSSTPTQVQIAVSAADAGAGGGTGSGVSHIDYWVNSATDGSANGTWTQLGSTQGSSGSLTWNTAGYAGGNHVVVANVFDNAGNCDCLPGGSDNHTTYTVIASCLPGTNLAASPYAQTILTDKPLGYWRLDETCAGLVGDSSGHGLTGQAFGGVTVGAAGAPLGDGDSAFTFDGQSGYVSLGDPSALQPAQLSVEAWVNTTATNEMVLRKRLYGYSLAINGIGQPTFGIDDGNAIAWTAQGPTSVADGNWHYLVGTYDGGAVRLYVDGVLVRTSPAGSIYYQPDLVAIGRDGSSPSGYFSGRIDDVAIYGTVLSPTQVQAHYGAAHSASTTATAVAQPTNTATATAIPTNTATATPLPTRTSTPVPSATNTAAPTATTTGNASSTATATSIPTSTGTATARATATSLPATATATATPPSLPGLHVTRWGDGQAISNATFCINTQVSITVTNAPANTWLAIRGPAGSLSTVLSDGSGTAATTFVLGNAPAGPATLIVQRDDWSWLGSSPSAPLLSTPITVNTTCGWATSTSGDLESHDSPTASVTIGNMGSGMLTFTVCGQTLGSLTTTSGNGTFTYSMSQATHLCNGIENVYPLRVTNTTTTYTAYAPTLYYYNFD